MPRHSRLLLFLFGLSLALASCNDRSATTPPDPMTPVWIERSVLSNYHGRDLHLYGNVTTTIGGTILHTDFSVMTTPSSLDLQWRSPSYDPTTDGSGHLVLKDGQGTVTMAIGGKATPFSTKDHSASMVLAMATGVSGGCAPLVNALWTGDATLFPPKATMEEHGDTCLLTGTNASGEVVVITIKDHKDLVHIREETPNASVASARSKLILDDDTIRKTLINEGLPATDQDIKTFKDTMAKALNKTSTVAGPIISDIVLSEQPLPPSQRPQLPTVPAIAPAPEAHDALSLPDQVHLVIEQAKEAHGTADRHRIADAILALEDVEVRISEMQIDNLNNHRDERAGIEGVDVQGIKTLMVSMQQELLTRAPPGSQPQPPVAASPK